LHQLLTLKPADPLVSVSDNQLNLFDF